jgi:hypothetical protein
MATIKLRDYLLALSSKGGAAGDSDKLTILDSSDGNAIKTILKSDLVDLDYLVGELQDDFLDQFGEGTFSGSAQVDHDSTTNFVANEHIDHTSVSIIAGAGLTGGGDISSDRTINIVSDNNGIVVNADQIELDTDSSTFSGGVLTKMNIEQVVSGSSQITITDTTGFTTLSSSLQSTDNAIATRVTAIESFSSSLDNTFASDSELTAVSSAFDSTINSLTTADVTEDSSNKYYTDVRVKTKLTAEDVVSGSNSQVKTFLGISASDISDVEAFSQSGTYSGLRAQSTTAADVGLGNVTNESKATMFASPTFTGTVAGVTSTHVGLGNVTNESKATMFTSPAFTTNPTAPTQTGTDDSTKLATTEFVQARITNIIGNAGSTLDTLGELSASLAEDSGSLSTLTTTVGTKLAKASNLSDLQDAATARTNLGVDAAGTVNYVLPTNLAGDDIDIDTTPLTGATVISDLDINITTNTSGLVTDANGTVATRTLTATDLSLGNVTNESKATMFTSPTFTGTVGGVTAAHVGLGSSDDVTFNTITGSKLELNDGAGGIVITAGLPNTHRFVGIGYRVGYGVVNTAAANTGLGYQALGGAGTINAGIGYSNTAVGSWALQKIVNGHDNIGIGKASATELTNGSDNTVVGTQAASSLTTGNKNIIIGNQSGNGVLGSGTALIDGSGNTILGSYSGFQNSDDYNSIVIGSGSIGNGSNTVVIGNDDITSTELKGNLSIGTGSADYIIHAKGTGLTNRIRLEEGTTQDQLTLMDVVGVDDELAAFGFGGSTYAFDLYKSRALVLANNTLDGMTIQSTNNDGSIIFGIGTSPTKANSERARVSAEGIHITGSLGISGDGSNGATLTESGNGDFDIISVDDLRLTAGGNDIVLKGNNGDEYGRLSNDSQNLIIKNITSDKDISFVGKDDATDITALTLDMSNGGSATFIDDVDLGGKLTQTGTGDNKFSGTVKISKDAAGLQQNLLLSNLNDTDGDAAGIAFSMLDNNTFVKGGLYFERTSTQGRGDLVFLNNNEVNGNNASLADTDARMKITAAGEVRIGNEYTVNANGLSIEKTGNHIFLRATSANTGEYWNFDVNSNNRLSIINDNDDGVYIDDAATSWTGTSDERLKTINYELTGSLENLEDIRAVNYSWVSGSTDKNFIGLIAQDVEQHYPEMISEDKFGYKGIRYTEMIPVLVSAIKEQQSIIDDLKSRIETLENS